MNPIAAVALITVLSWQVGIGFEQVSQRKRVYARAQQYADERGKPLLVAGGPWGASFAYVPWRIFNIAPHGFGDVCVDISAKACKGAPVQAIADIRDIGYPDGYFGAAYASHILEHMHSVDECEEAIDELLRVADAVFVVGPSKQSITAWISTRHHLWVNQKGDSIIIERRYGSFQKSRYRFIDLPDLTRPAGIVYTRSHKVRR